MRLFVGILFGIFCDNYLGNSRSCNLGKTHTFSTSVVCKFIYLSDLDVRQLHEELRRAGGKATRILNLDDKRN